MITIKIPCGEPQTVGWTCNEGHLCDKCSMLEHILKFWGEQ